jgi:membrane protein
MFKILPDVKIAWRDVMAGSILTAILFAIGKIALTFYFGKAEPDATYGAAGSIILILLWVSYSGMIFFYGAEFTKQNLIANGKKVQPGNGAANIPADCTV